MQSAVPKESWDSVVAAISNSQGSEKLKFDEIQDVVLSESLRQREMRIHLVVLLVLTKEEEVNRRAKTKVDQNQRTVKIFQTDQM